MSWLKSNFGVSGQYKIVQRSWYDEYAESVSGYQIVDEYDVSNINEVIFINVSSNIDNYVRSFRIYLDDVLVATIPGIYLADNNEIYIDTTNANKLSIRNAGVHTAGRYLIIFNNNSLKINSTSMVGSGGNITKNGFNIDLTYFNNLYLKCNSTIDASSNRNIKYAIDNGTEQTLAINNSINIDVSLNNKLIIYNSIAGYLTNFELQLT